MFKQPKELPVSERMFIREKLRNLSRRNNEPDSLVMVSIETVMLGAFCSWPLPQLAASWGSEAAYPSPGSLWL